MTDTALDTLEPGKASPAYWHYVAVALLVFVFGSLAINMAATRASSGAAIQSGFSDGALETIIPVDLAPWWLAARAQLDCQQLMPLISNKSDITSAVSRPKLVLADRKVNACTLLASVAERKRFSANIRETTRHDGFHSAGSLTLPAISFLGIQVTRWASVLVLLAAAGGGLWIICTGHALGGRRDRVAATLCMTIATAFILAVPGSLTAIPTMALLVGSMAGVLILLEHNRAGPDIILKLSPMLAAALVSLDPVGGSVPVGLGCILLLARMVAPPQGSRGVLLRTAGLYMLTVILCWLTYAVLVGVTDSWGSAVEVLQNQVLDVREAGRIGDFGAAAVGTYRWLSSEVLLGPLGAFDLLFSILFGLMLYSAVQPLHPDDVRMEPLVTALLAIAPVLLWALLYPGYWRRAEEQYVLPLMWLAAVALAGPFALLVEFARRIARGRAKSKPMPDAEATALA